MANAEMIEQSEPQVEEQRKPILEEVLTQVRFLSHEDRLRLIQCVAADLLSNAPTLTPRRIVYGEFNRGGRMSTEEDFKLAEWHPDESEWE
jgi:hypothetical protein